MSSKQFEYRSEPPLPFLAGCIFSMWMPAGTPCRTAVLLVGEPGSQKRSIAALVHYVPIMQHNHPVVGLDANTMSRTAGLFLDTGATLAAQLARAWHTRPVQHQAGEGAEAESQPVGQRLQGASLLVGHRALGAAALAGDSMLILSNLENTQQVRERGLEANFCAGSL